MNSDSPQTLIEAKKISKYYPGVVALDKVDFDLVRGEVHCLLGENGAGKSTLVKILAGVHQPDNGEVLIDGQAVVIENRHHSSELGLAFIFQELSVVDGLTVAENIVLGSEPRRGMFFNKAAANSQVEPILEKIGFPQLDVNKLVGTLSAAERQGVMIARALYREANIIVMDEPTSSLSGDEANLLLDVVRQLRDEGRGIIYISHRLNEIFQIADRVTVFKDGAKVITESIDALTEDKIVQLMVGREVNLMFPPKNRKPGAVVLKVENLYNQHLKNVSFELREGEILGVSGLVGAGRTELLRAIFGVDKIRSGTVECRDSTARITRPQNAILRGISLVPEDRRGQGIIPQQSVKHNLMMIWSHFAAIRKKTGKEEKIAEELVSDLQIKTPSLDQSISFLSGGNQQKVVVGKWLACNASIMLLDEPTRGIDINAKLEMYHLIDKLAHDGMAVMLVSSELPEIIGMADRTLVLRGGEVAGQLGKDASEEEIIRMAMWTKQAAA